MLPAEFKAAVHEVVQVKYLEDYKAYRDKVDEDGSIEDYRKLVQMSITMLGLDAEKKVDDKSSLPVFNITFNSGRMSMEPVITIEAEQDDTLEMFTWTPSAAMLASSNINQDLAGC
jgi:hypothetical protein